jgi:uncharacterized protein (DUF362 family)
MGNHGGPAPVSGQDPRVWVTASAHQYEGLVDQPLPELAGPGPFGNRVLSAMRALFAGAGLDRARYGRPDWNPLADLIPARARVVVKPNWVTHANAAGAGLDCLVTHTAVLHAILEYVVKTGPASVIVGDAPVQGCDFERLMAATGAREMAASFRSRGIDVEIKDFRAALPAWRSTVATGPTGTTPEGFILYDLAGASALEDVVSPERFRVTMYDPDAMRQSHGRGRHQYLVARDVMAADVVISVPKLKTHKKACLTGALKNPVGINGHKAFLPHHRKGGSETGGDCYRGGSPVKRVVEDLLDAMNRPRRPVVRPLVSAAARLGMAADRVLGGDGNFEGSWSGNDTVWRMCLDLHHVLLRGRLDGTLADRPQRRLLTITDAIVAGQGEGPLAPTPIELGLLTFGTSPAAVDWVHAVLMGCDPERIPLTREAFRKRPRPLTAFSPDDIRVSVDGTAVPLDRLFGRCGRRFRLPAGWLGSAEKQPQPGAPEADLSVSCETTATP